MLGYNMYAYCNNNPVNLSDPTGTCAYCATEYAIKNPYPNCNDYNTCPTHYLCVYFQDKWKREYCAAYNRKHPKTPVDNAEDHLGCPQGSHECGVNSRSNPGHGGQDFMVPTGSNAYSTVHGRVTEVGIYSTYGLRIEIIPWDSTLPKTIYAHLSESCVNKGDIVYRGQIIGLTGGAEGDSRDGLSTGPHLHYVGPKTWLD